jgi:hypothetical protein
MQALRGEGNCPKLPKLIKCTSSRSSLTLSVHTHSAVLKQASPERVQSERKKSLFCQATPRNTFEMTRDVNNVIFATVNKSTREAHVETLNNAIRQQNKLTNFAVRVTHFVINTVKV